MTEHDLAMIIIGMCLAAVGICCVDRIKIYNQDNAWWREAARDAQRRFNALDG